MCINIDLTSAQLIQNSLTNLFYTEEVENEEFPKDANEFLEMMTQNVLKKINKPINLLSKNDKLKIVEFLFKNKIFKIKGGVDILANKLKVSRYTIYSYIDQIKASSNELP